jgi:metal-responsive CopG/Arc/MetJ family transcriptional regulator
MKAEEFDKIFDDNEEDIVEYLDMSTIRRPNLEPKRINIDFPTWMVKKLDEEAQHIGVSRQAIIKTWLADKIMQIEQHEKNIIWLKRYKTVWLIYTQVNSQNQSISL